MKPRPAFALAAALMALVLIAVLVTGAMFAANQDSRSGAAEMLDQRATAFAELAVLTAMSSWDAAACDGLAVGGVIVENPVADNSLESTVYITRLDTAVFLVVGEGRVTSGGATLLRRRISLAVISARDPGGAPRVTRVSEQAWSAVYEM